MFRIFPGGGSHSHTETHSSREQDTNCIINDMVGRTKYHRIASVNIRVSSDLPELQIQQIFHEQCSANGHSHIHIRRLTHRTVNPTSSNHRRTPSLNGSFTSSSSGLVLSTLPAISFRTLLATCSNAPSTIFLHSLLGISNGGVLSPACVVNRVGEDSREGTRETPWEAI